MAKMTGKSNINDKSNRFAKPPAAQANRTPPTPPKGKGGPWPMMGKKK